MKKSIFFVSILTFFVSCASRTDMAEANVNITIYTFGAVEIKDEENRRNISISLQKMCKILEEIECNQSFEPKAKLQRIESETTYNLYSVASSSGTSNPNHPAQIKKRITRFFGKEIDVPQKFTEQVSDSAKVIHKIKEKLSKSSEIVLVLYEKENENQFYTLDEKKYPIYSNIDDIRKRIASEWCKNPNKNIIVLLNPFEIKQAGKRKTIAELQEEDKKIEKKINLYKDSLEIAQKGIKNNEDRLKDPKIDGATKSQIQEQIVNYKKLYEDAITVIKNLEKEKEDLRVQLEEEKRKNVVLTEENNRLRDREKGVLEEKNNAIADRDKINEQKEDVEKENNDLKKKIKIIMISAYPVQIKGGSAKNLKKQKAKHTEAIQISVEFDRYLEQGEYKEFYLIQPNGKKTKLTNLSSNNGEQDKIYSVVAILADNLKDTLEEGSHSILIKVGNVESSAGFRLN